jgi:hypothetical protein
MGEGDEKTLSYGSRWNFTRGLMMFLCKFTFFRGYFLSLTVRNYCFHSRQSSNHRANFRQFVFEMRKGHECLCFLDLKLELEKAISYEND